MREIKFRAWSESFGLSESFKIGGCPVFRDGATMPYWSSLAVIEQFTGLHDKNGKEIYEGDIVRSAVLLSGEMVNNTVRRIDCGFIANGLLGRREAENCEVIGNIHENPELIK